MVLHFYDGDDREKWLKIFVRGYDGENKGWETLSKAKSHY